MIKILNYLWPFRDPAFYVLNLLEERKFTQVDVQFVMDTTTQFVNQTVSSVLDEALQALEKEGCAHADVLKQMRDFFSLRSNAIVHDPFEGIHHSS